MSVSVHIAPRPVNIAMYGGNPVSSENTGTARRAAMPAQNTSCPRGASSEGSGKVDSSSEPSSSTWFTRNANEPTRQTTEGKKSSVTVGTVDRLLLIQSIVVVTSPIGVQTPPAFAATTTIAPKRRRSSSLGTSFRSKDTMTIVTVRLFNMAERKKVRKPITQNNVFFDFVVIKLVTTLKPWCASTTSTMVEAARRKKQISDTSESCSLSCSRTDSDATPSALLK
mmetsp:Transcript_47424/g.143563  ORF Transcript_47424/g.143563 Transcript_47424/m.143563 type:complete len:225 (-) Transcript_47424:1424-2098(-)